MSNTLPLMIAVGVFAGGAGAVATTVLIGSDSDRSASESIIAAADSELLADVNVLHEDFKTLTDRLDALELSANLAPINTGGPRSAASVDRTEIEDIVKDVLGSLGTDGGPIVAGTPGMQAAVDNAIDMREERQRQERNARRAEQQTKRLEDKLAKLQTDLGMDQNQTNSMRTIFQDEETRREEMGTRMREARESGSADMGDMRQMWGDMRTATNTAVEGVLSSTQYEQYQESQQSNRWGGRTRGGNNNNNNNNSGGGGRRGN